MSNRFSKSEVRWNVYSVVALAVFAVLLLPAVTSAQSSSDDLIGDDIVIGEECHGKLYVITYAYSGGSQVNIPSGGGWTLYQNNAYFDSLNNGGASSPHTKTYSWIVGNKTYKVIGKPVSGWKISYYSSDYGSWGHNTTYLRDDDTDTLKVKYTACPAKLIVDIEPNGGVPGGSYSVAGPAGTLASGKKTDDTFTIDGSVSKPFGIYTVTFTNATGYTEVVTKVLGDFTGTGLSKSGKIDPGDTHKIKGVYTPKPAKLIVDIEPNGGVPGGSYSVTGPGGSLASGKQADDTFTIDGSASKPFGTYTVTFTDATGYTEVVTKVLGDFTGTGLTKSGKIDPGDTHKIKGVYTEIPPDPAKLIIDIVPDGGVTGGFYTVTGPAGFTTLNNQTTDQTITIDDSSSKPFGTYTVTFADATGYTEVVTVEQGDFTGGPLSKSGSVDEGETHEIKGVYTEIPPDPAKLIIDIEPNGGVTGGFYTVTGPAGFTTLNNQKNDQTINIDDSSSYPFGTYTVTFADATGYSETVTVEQGDFTGGPLSKSGSVDEGETHEIKGVYSEDPPDPAKLIIDIEPNGGVPGGSYSVAGPAGFTTISNQQNDQTITVDDSATKPFGTYTVTFTDATGYSETVTVEQGDFTGGALAKSGSVDAGETHEIKGVYDRDLGEMLNVITELAGGGTLPTGSGWDLDDPKPAGFTGTPDNKDTGGLGSGDDQGISPAVTGDYSVTGRAVAGYSISYSPQNGTLALGGVLTLKVIYSLNQVDDHEVNAIYWDPIGGVQVPGGTITPGGTVTVADGGSQNFTATTLPTGWSLTGGSAFTGTGSSSMVGNVGTVSNVKSDGTLRIYLEQAPAGPGELEVIILPGEVNAAGARWKHQGSGSLKTSGTVEVQPAGFYDLECIDVPDWITPPAQSAQVFSGQRTTVTFVYGQQVVGALQVFIEDNLDDRVKKKLGAQWQPIFPPSFGIPNDPNKWYNHGDIIHNLPPGEVGLKFKTITGWIFPELTGAEVFPNKTTKETGRYWRVLIIHKSDYNGDGTDDLAVFNKSTRKWEVASISKPAGGPAAKFMLFEKKFGKKDDFPTAGDYDGDGKADLAYWRETTGEWNVRKQFKLKNFGEEHDIPVPGDYDADGKTDPALYRPSTGEWFIYDRELDEIITVNFGGELYVPVPGNYDADEDGRTDLAIFNIASQQWRVAFWSDKKEEWVEKKKIRVSGRKIKLRDNYGAIGNVPVHADYDGDGATDLAIYKRRPSQWTIRDQFEVQLGEHLDVPVPNDWAGLGRVIPTIFHGQNGRWLSIDDLLKTKHGKGGQPLMSGR